MWLLFTIVSTFEFSFQLPQRPSLCLLPTITANISKRSEAHSCGGLVKDDYQKQVLQLYSLWFLVSFCRPVATGNYFQAMFNLHVLYVVLCWNTFGSWHFPVVLHFTPTDSKNNCYEQNENAYLKFFFFTSFLQCEHYCICKFKNTDNFLTL